MEWNQLPAIILMFVMIGMLIGVGIITFDKFGSATKETVTVTSDEIVWVDDQSNVSLSHGNLTSFSRITNSTGSVVPTGNYSVTLLSGVVQVRNTTSTFGLPCAEGNTCYADYVYTESDTAANSAMSYMSDAVAGISSTWLPLIVTIIALALVMGLVLTAFAFGRR